MTVKQLADLYISGPEYVVTPDVKYALAQFTTEQAHKLFTATGFTWSLDPNGPNDYPTLVDSVGKTHNVAIDPYFLTGPVLDGWLNIEFRAWHDLIHYLSGNTFSVWGEAGQAWLHTQATDNDLFAKLFISEVLLPAAAYTEYGPDDKRPRRAVLVSDEWLQAFRLLGPEAIHLDYTDPAPNTQEYELASSTLDIAQSQAAHVAALAHK